MPILQAHLALVLLEARPVRPEDRQVDVDHEIQPVGADRSGRGARRDVPRRTDEFPDTTHLVLGHAKVLQRFRRPPCALVLVVVTLGVV